jgi:hypothetical protein
MKLPAFQNQINFQFNVDENNTIGKIYEKHLHHQISDKKCLLIQHNVNTPNEIPLQNLSNTPNPF